jgi:cobalt-zinc-cadmium efflux system outer membrane protein
MGTELSNPIVGYQIEDAAGVRDEFLTFEQQLPVPGRRSLLGARADAAAAAAGLLGEHDLRDAAHSLRIAFYDVLYRDKVVDLLRRGGEDLEQTLGILREREKEGEGSGYDVLRVEQETAGLQVELGRAEAEAIAARVLFGSFFDGSLAMGSADFRGTLTTARVPWSAAEALSVALSGRVDLLALREEARQEEMELRAARRQAIPEPVLTAGWKRVAAMGDSDTGYVAALMVPLPIFGRGRFEAARSLAASSQIELREQILERRIRAEVESARARALAAWDASERLDGPTVQRTEQLREIARVAYEEGEMRILDLLDALRISSRVEMQALTSRHEAKRERIELERAMGIEVKP